MKTEIERKFLVKGEFKHFVKDVIKIKQGYLNSDPERSVRVRILEDKAVLTVKGISDGNGLTRFEWEKDISIEEGESLFLLCEPGKISKERNLIDHEGFIWEVDVFFEENEGLVLAEIELENEGQHFSIPEWIGEEVTGDVRYYNSYLVKHPFSSWEE